MVGTTTSARPRVSSWIGSEINPRSQDSGLCPNPKPSPAQPGHNITHHRDDYNFTTPTHTTRPLSLTPTPPSPKPHLDSVYPHHYHHHPSVSMGRKATCHSSSPTFIVSSWFFRILPSLLLTFCFLENQMAPLHLILILSALSGFLPTFHASAGDSDPIYK